MDKFIENMFMNKVKEGKRYEMLCKENYLRYKVAIHSVNKHRIREFYYNKRLKTVQKWLEKDFVKGE